MMFFKTRVLLLFFCFCLLSDAYPINNQQEKCSEQNCDSYGHEVLKYNANPPTPQEICKFCYAALPLIRYLVSENRTELFPELAIVFCDIFKIVDDTVCRYAVNEFKFSVLTVLHDSQLSAHELCNAGFKCGPVVNPVFDWNITLPAVPKPPVSPIVPPKPDAPKLRILHLSDLHIDFEYIPGSVAECGEPLCCRKNIKPVDNTTGAGYWGDYRNCDTPLWTVQNMMQYISENEVFDFIYMTGDLPPHNVWNQTRNDQLTSVSVITQLFQKYFPDKVIYSSVGNHEAAPVNLFPPDNVKEDSISWLYSALANNWTKTGVPSSVFNDILNGAFYTAKIFNGLRVISLNMNYCSFENFWLYINATDPLQQLEWLANVLQQSENIGEKVHIIGHHPPSSCLDSWGYNYIRIVNRYESTIAGQFFGHSHKDLFKLFYDLNNITRATNVAYLAPSVTPGSYLNPGYRIYTLDGDYQNSSFQVLDQETIFMNLTDANLTNKPKWQLEYNARDAYKLENLYPSDWDLLVNNMLSDIDGYYAALFYKYYSKSSDSYFQCDSQCLKNLICDLKQASSAIRIPCQ